MKVKIFDAIMGSGKTHNAIERMKKSNKNFLYVTPFLDEVQRIVESVPKVKQPQTIRYENYDGELEVRYKRDDLLRMATRKINLATTHSLFSKLHRTDYKFFADYDLILDEVITPVKVIDMKPDDIAIAIREGLIVVNENTGEVTYTSDSYEGRFFSELKKLCETRNVTHIDNRLLVWTFPPEIFTSFRSVSVLTYMFESSLLARYFDYYEIPYKLIKKSSREESKTKIEIAKCLNIYEGLANNVGNFPTSFSKNWLKRRSNREIKTIKTTVANLLNRNFESISKETVYTTFKDFEIKLKGKGYSKGFIPVNERATNKYSDKCTMIYLANRYLNPNIVDFFRTGSIEFDQNAWALGELLQWIWRGSIRNGERMNLYIPSKRMRNLLKEWLNDIDSGSLNQVS